jgi:hypothetical protein
MSAGKATLMNGSRSEVLQYETPQVIELGGVVDLTNGNTDRDTADMNQYYY